MKRKAIVSTILSSIIGVACTVAVVENMERKKIRAWKSMSDKHLELFLLMNEWMKTKQEGKHIKEYFEKNGYKSIAVYGLSYVGERVVDELRDSGIEVKYAIDKNADSIYTDIEVYSPENKLPEVDVIVVTAIRFFDEIYDSISDKAACPIVSFEDILFEID